MVGESSFSVYWESTDNSNHCEKGSLRHTERYGDIGKPYLGKSERNIHTEWIRRQRAGKAREVTDCANAEDAEYPSLWLPAGLAWLERALC